MRLLQTYYCDITGDNQICVEDSDIAAFVGIEIQPQKSNMLALSCHGHYLN